VYLTLQREDRKKKKGRLGTKRPGFQEKSKERYCSGVPEEGNGGPAQQTFQERGTEGKGGGEREGRSPNPKHGEINKKLQG